MTRQSSFAKVLGSAMAARNLPLDRLASRLQTAGAPVSVATLSYWRAGRSVPTRGNSVRAVEALEEILEVPPGYLTGALPGEALTRWDPLPVLHSPDVVRRVVEDELGLSLNRRLTVVHHHESLIVGPDRVQESSVVTQLVRCEVDEVAAQFVVVQQDSAKRCAPRVEALTGCTTGRTFSFAEQHLCVVELNLPRAFHRGELLAMSYRIVWAPTDAPDNRMVRALPSQVRYLVQEVRFDGEPPQGVVARLQNTLDSPPTSEREVRAGPFVQQVVEDAEPGLHVLQWTW